MRAVPVGLALLLVAFVSPSTGRSTRGLVGAPPLETRAWEANCAVNNVAPGPARGAGLFLSRLRGAGEDGAQIGGRMGDLAMMADRQGFDIGASLGGEAAAPSPFHLGNATVAEEDRVARATKDARQKQHELCQLFMDNIYENVLRPMVDKLENQVYEGDAGAAESRELQPYKGFPADAAEVLNATKEAVASKLQELRVDLEVAHLAAARGGRPVSTVEFKMFPRDDSRVSQLLLHVEQESIASANRALSRLWRQHKTLIRDCHVDAFVFSFEQDISGSKAFNRSTHALCRKGYRSCEKAFKESIPPGCAPKGKEDAQEWRYDGDLADFKEIVNGKIASRRKQSGVDLLAGEWTEGADAPAPFLSVRWFKKLAVKGVVTYYQFCQSAWAVRKAQGIAYPTRFTKLWFMAVLVPWENMKPLQPLEGDSSASSQGAEPVVSPFSGKFGGQLGKSLGRELGNKDKAGDANKDGKAGRDGREGGGQGDRAARKPEEEGNSLGKLLRFLTP